MNRQFLFASAAMLLCLAATVVADRPNIVFILADDKCDPAPW